jgi:ABC-2 type transport system ATP-binding protein
MEAVADLPAAAEALTKAGAQVTTHPEHLTVNGVDKPAWVTRTLAEQKLYLAELAPVTVDLESVFLELTGTAPVPGEHRQVDESVEVAA